MGQSILESLLLLQNYLVGHNFSCYTNYKWAIHEGNGVRHTIVDEQATKEQREALIALDRDKHGGLYWEIFAAVCPNLTETVFAPITLTVDREKRLATIQIRESQSQRSSQSRAQQPARNIGRGSRCQMASNTKKRKWVTR
jgi:hypothetical protein